MAHDIQEECVTTNIEYRDDDIKQFEVRELVMERNKV